MVQLMARESSRMIIGIVIIMVFLGGLAIPPEEQPVIPSYKGPIPEGAVIPLGNGSISTMALSSDGRHLAVSTLAGVYLYDARNFRLRWMSPESGFWTLMFSPDGTTLAGLDRPSTLGDDQGRTVTWNVKTGAVERILDTGGIAMTWQGNLIAFPHVQLLEDETGMFEPEWGIDLVELTTGKAKADSILPLGVVLGEVAFSPMGSEMAISTSETTLLILDRFSGEVLREIPFLYGYPVGLVYSADGSMLVIQSFYTVFIVDPVSGEILFNLSPPEGGIQSVSFSPNGQSVAVGMLDQTVSIWHLATVEMQTWQMKSIAREFAWSPRGTHLYIRSDDSQISVRDVKANTSIRRLDRHFAITDHIS
jgi:WD40 repeat protein